MYSNNQIHMHVCSLNDAFIEPQKLAEKLKGMGATHCAITDHGVVSSIEDFRPIFESYGITLVPGVELYLDGGILGREHLIALAKNNDGWHGIAKLITAANLNMDGDYPVLSRADFEAIMDKYRGSIIFTSACIQGPICATLLANKKVEKEIGKLQKKQAKYLNPCDSEVSSVEEELSLAKKSVSDMVIARDTTKALAEMKFSQREKSIAKAEKGGKDVAELKTRLEADKNISEEAKEKLSSVKEKLSKAQKYLSEMTKRAAEVEKSVESYMEIEEDIVTLKAELKDDATLYVEAVEIANQFKHICGENCFYVEVQYHGIEDEKVYATAVKIARECNLPIVASNDVHILNNTNEERLRRQLMRSLRFGKWEEESVGDDQLYLKTGDEVADALSNILSKEDIEEAMTNIDVILHQCNVKSFAQMRSEGLATNHYPQWDNAEETSKIKLQEGVDRIFGGKLSAEYEERLNYELSIIKEMGYVDYLLVVADYLEYGRLLGKVPRNRVDEAPLSIEELKVWIEENDWQNTPSYTIGVGRGSGVGALTCYLLGITFLDPIKLGLLFERFLNPERVSMPDIDSDLSKSVRSKVIDYVNNKYGMVQIMTKNALAPKGCIRNAAKYYGLAKAGESMIALGDVIAREVPPDVGVSFSTIVDESGKVSQTGISLAEYLVKKHEKNKDMVGIIEWAQTLEGVFTSYGAHASGILTAAGMRDFSDELPLRYNKKLDCMTTQCDMVQCEENGFLKFDFLGLKTCDIIDGAIKEIYTKKGINIDPLNLNTEDSKVYKEIFSSGKTNSVFQFESVGMKSMLKRFKPTCFEDLIILVSMFRPGPLQYLDSVIETKNG